MLAARALDEAEINTFRDRTVGGATHLDKATLLGDLPLVRALLALGAAVNARRPDAHGDGTTALFWVCWGARAELHEAVCLALLNGGADATVQNVYGDTPLHWAAERCSVAVCALLLDQGGADVNAASGLASSRETALHRVLERGLFDHDGRGALALEAADDGALAELRLADDADASWEDEGDEAADGLAPPGARADPLPLLELLLAKGADINARAKDGVTPLHAAAKGGSAALIARMLEAGAPHSRVDRLGRSPIHHAAMYGHGAACVALARGGAALEDEDAHGDAPLALAEEAHHHDAMAEVRRALSGGAFSAVLNRARALSLSPRAAQLKKMLKVPHKEHATQAELAVPGKARAGG